MERQIKKLDELMDGALTERFNQAMDEVMRNVADPNTDPKASDTVVKLAGSIRQEQNIEKADDGVSQRVTVNQGVATAANVVVKNPVYLTPMRTFPEVEQPESPFVLRFNNEARVALFSGDGGAWKLEAVAKVTEYLRSNLMGRNVVVIG